MFVHMSVHYPDTQWEGRVIDSMHRFGKAMEGQEGHREAHTLKDDRTGRLIGLAIWESKEAWEKALPMMHEAVKDDDFETWEERPPEVFHLEAV